MIRATTALTDITSENLGVQQTFAEHLEVVLGWDRVYAGNEEAFGPEGTLGRSNERGVVLVRDSLWPRLMDGRLAV